MSDTNYGTDPAYPVDPAQAVPDQIGTDADIDTHDIAADGALSTRARAQRRFDQARVSTWDAAARARVAASARRAAKPTDDPDEPTTPAATLGERAQAYRVHIVSVVGAATVALLLAVVRRRAARRRADAEIDLGTWRLHAQPTEPSGYTVS